MVPTASSIKCQASGIAMSSVGRSSRGSASSQCLTVAVTMMTYAPVTSVNALTCARSCQQRESVCVCDRQTNRQTRRGQRFPRERKCQCREKESIKTRGTRERGEEKRVRHDLMILLDERGRLKYMIVVPTSACIGDSKDREV
jgi:hypothetical protein